MLKIMDFNISAYNLFMFKCVIVFYMAIGNLMDESNMHEHNYTYEYEHLHGWLGN